MGLGDKALGVEKPTLVNTLSQAWTPVSPCGHLSYLFALETPEEGKKPHSEQEEERQAEGRGWYSQGDIGRPIDVVMAWIGSVMEGGGQM